MNKKLKTLAALLIISQGSAKNYTDQDLLGVYKLTKFATVNADGTETPWCNGATGTIAYVPGYMGVAINCESVEPNSNAAELKGKLFYSGPYEVDTQTNEVLHRVRNYSHSSLHKVNRRKVELRGKNHLILSGNLGEGKQIVIEWERQESFAYDNNPLTGFYELVGSENKIEGSDETIPFCSGFHGSIFYTPGGYGAVSINCGEKIDPNAAEPADAFGRHYFYAGPYEQSEGLLVQKIQTASELNQVGEEARRAMEIKDDLLTLKGVNGSTFVAKWRKLRSFVGIE
ncbi:MAG: lipocalin-like domain-containing protein [Bdellovibrionota bacterium]